VVDQTWKFFVGACILTGGLLLKAGAPVRPVAMGFVLGAGITWLRQRLI